MYESKKAGKWLDECDYVPDNARIAEHRAQGGHAFKGWRCALAVQPRIAAGIGAILRAGGAAAVIEEWGPAALASASHVFADSGSELPLPGGANLAAAVERQRKGQLHVLQIEFLFRFLCVEDKGSRGFMQDHQMKMVPPKPAPPIARVDSTSIH